MIDIGDLVIVTDVMRSQTYASPLYQQYGIVLDIDDGDFGNVEGIEVLLVNTEIRYCFPEEIKICSRLFEPNSTL